MVLTPAMQLQCHLIWEDLPKAPARLFSALPAPGSPVTALTSLDQNHLFRIGHLLALTLQIQLTAPGLPAHLAQGRPWGEVPWVEWKL